MKITMLFAALSAASGAFAAPAQAVAAAKDLSIGAGVGIGIGAGVGPYGYPYGAYPGWRLQLLPLRWLSLQWIPLRIPILPMVNTWCSVACAQNPSPAHLHTFKPFTSEQFLFL
uniref:Protein USP1 n=1 Tax=Puccinia graminis TaxID=5297 RepID=USP1_PUCGR|nr:RecName: Full=Protein USP1; Flags: Precursor [Puccinia graminis]AAB48194.1 usp1 [Puccinia graminis f. sp. tritici]